MEKLRVSFRNPGGELDFRTASGPEAAARAAVEMIEAAGELHDGDAIEVQEDEEAES